VETFEEVRIIKDFLKEYWKIIYIVSLNGVNGDWNGKVARFGTRLHKMDVDIE
jgi:hypothetical protein